MENETVFGEVAASVLYHNFYVDDFVKSVEGLDSAKQLVNDVINMCKSVGFYLTKFTSNNKKLLLSVSEHERRMEVKDQDLSGDLPNEKVLGICKKFKGRHSLLLIKAGSKSPNFKSYAVNDNFNL